jgi:hypothetical protein
MKAPMFRIEKISIPKWPYWTFRYFYKGKEVFLSASCKPVDVDKNELAELLDFHGVVRAGDVLVVESDRALSAEAYRQLAEQFELVHAKYDVGMILLDYGLRVAGKKPT